MSILGDTIDYGPYGFLERFNPDFTPNTTDLNGRRYAFRNQPHICQWNCAQLANALIAADLLTAEEAQGALEQYADALSTLYETRMAGKLGLGVYDKDLSTSLMTLMYEDAADFTNTFRYIGETLCVRVFV